MEARKILGWIDIMVVEVAMGLDAADILAPIGVMGGAGIAALVAWLNGRKTPADRLQSLITIYKDWPPADVPGRQHVIGLIQGQLGEMRHRYPYLDAEATTGAGFSAIDRAAGKHLCLDIAATGFSLLALVGIGIYLEVNWPIDQGVEITVSLVAGFVLFVAATRLTRVARHYVWAIPPRAPKP